MDHLLSKIESPRDLQGLSPRELEQLAAEMRAQGLSVTMSVGVATSRQPAPDALDMLRVADELMYAVKFGGKNAVAIRVLEPADTTPPRAVQSPRSTG